MLTYPLDNTEDYGHCGIWSMRYVHITLRQRDISIRKLRELSGKTVGQLEDEGLDEDILARMGRELSFETKIVRYKRKDPERVLRDLDDCTADGGAAIVSWHRWYEPHFHWVCVTSVDERYVRVVDSNLTDEDYPTSWKRKRGECVGNMTHVRFKHWITMRAGSRDPDKHLIITFK